MRKLLWLGGFSVAMVAGCISYEQKITFQPDGSGTVVADMWVDRLSPTADDEGPAVEAPTPEVSEEMGPAFADLEGVAVAENWVKVEGEGDDRREHTRLALNFGDVGKLVGHGIFDKQELSFRKEGDNFVFAETIHNNPQESESSAESEELARAMFEGYTFTYTVVMPAAVVETNGTLAENQRTVTWSWPLYDFATLDEIVMTATAAAE